MNVNVSHYCYVGPNGNCPICFPSTPVWYIDAQPNNLVCNCNMVWGATIPAPPCQIHGTFGTFGGRWPIEAGQYVDLAKFRGGTFTTSFRMPLFPEHQYACMQTHALTSEQLADIISALFAAFLGPIEQ